jgi:phage baseplate assembly protein W
MMKEILGSGISFPLGVDQQGGVALAHDATDVEQAIWLILSTAPGERPMRPEFGCAAHDYVFDRIDGETIAQIEREVRLALDRWEPRVEVESIEFELGRADVGQLLVDLTYRIRSTNDVRNLVYPFYVVPAEEEEEPA